MATANVIAFLAIFLVLVLNPTTVKSDDLAPVLSPYFDQICNEVECGKGNCSASINYPLGYRCECQKGWKRVRLDEDDTDKLKFLPCVIPNCTLDYSCMEAPPPVPAKDVPINSSFFDPCYWIYCGEGTCNKTSNYKHICQCKPGFQNLLNVSYFPCYSECTLGQDCASLGIKVSNATSGSTTPPSSPSDSTGSSNQGSSILPGNFYWLMILMMSMAMVPWK